MTFVRSTIRSPALSLSSQPSELLLEVQVAVHALDLIRVAVEHQRSALQEFADAALGPLRPPWMVDHRVHVRVETVLVRRRALPGIERLLGDELDLVDR